MTETSCDVGRVDDELAAVRDHGLHLVEALAPVQMSSYIVGRMESTRL
jgi:hypothetical protein